MADPPNVVSMTGIAKFFPGVVALEDVDFSLRKGEIHALMGENGAGKSTLIKVLTGVEHPDKGTIELDGKPVQVRSPQHSQELGISTVYQEVNLCTNITVAENIMLGHEPRRFGSINWKKMNDLARQALKRLGIDVDVTQPLGNYSLAIQQMVAIARALEILSAKVLILDEPTSSLDIHETEPALRGDAQTEEPRALVLFSSPISWIRCTRLPTGSRCSAMVNWSAHTTSLRCRASS